MGFINDIKVAFAPQPPAADTAKKRAEQELEYLYSTAYYKQSDVTTRWLLSRHIIDVVYDTERGKLNRWLKDSESALFRLFSRVAIYTTIAVLTVLGCVIYVEMLCS